MHGGLPVHSCQCRLCLQCRVRFRFSDRQRLLRQHPVPELGFLLLQDLVRRRFPFRYQAALVEHLHEHKKAQARTLFATHYHELNEMEKNFPRIKNFNVSVKEVDGKVIFLRKLEPGGSEHSFGIHVAEIAGMPRSIVNRANDILKQLEQDNAGVGGAGKPNVQHLDEPKEGVQLSFFQLDDPVLSQIRDEILGLDVNNLTPVEALNKLNDIKKILLGR